MALKSFSKTAPSLLLVLVFTSAALAQFRSAIEGTVTDPSGGIVSEAQITLVNVETGVSQTAKTNSAGSYSFPTLPPGKYKITVSARGFTSLTQENITLGGAETRTISLALKVGDVSETVTVTSEPAPVQSSEAKVATNISTTQIRNLPMAGRNILDLVSLSPGVTGVGNLAGQAGGSDIFSLVGNPSVNANGQRADGNGYYVDGVSANSNPDPGEVYVTLNPDSVAEFSVALNDYSAEYGRSGSIVVNAVSKSGSNSFHGSLFEYHRNNKLTARNVLQNTPNAITGRILPASRRNEFGFSLGGPIIKDKMFFFGALDALRSSVNVTNRATVETPEFVNFMKANFPKNVSTFLLTNFPVGDIGPFEAGTVQTVAQVMTASSLGACSGKNSLGMPCGMPMRGSVIRSFAPTRNGLQWNVRVDRYFNDSKDRVHVNYQRRTAESEGTQFRTAFRNGFASRPLTYYANLNWTHTFSSTVVNEAAVGFTRFTGNQDCSFCQIPPIGAPGLQEGFGNGFSPALFIQNDWNWRDVLSINRGKHSLKMGAEIFRDQENDQFSGPQQRPGYNFRNLFDFAADIAQTQTGVNYDLRDRTPSFQDVQYRTTTFGFFVQDNWKAKKNLSLNLGLRWDFSSNPYEKNGRMSTVILGSGQTFQQRIANASVGIVPNLYEEHRKAYFAPRLSFAWTPERFNNRMSIRGGMGVFMTRLANIGWTDQIRANPPFQSSITASVDTPTGPQPVYGLCALDVSPFNCPFPTGLRVGVNERGGPIGARAGIGGTAPDLRNAYTINRFFGIQYAFTSNWILEANYLGSQGVHLYLNNNRNRFVGDRNANDGTIDRLNPFFAGIGYTDNSGWSHYDGGTVSLNKRFNRGYTFMTSFTFGKTMSVQDATGTGRASLLSPIVDAYNINAQRGLASFDISKRLSFNLVYDVPKNLFGNRIASAAFGNWQLGVIGSFQDGYPFWVLAGEDLNGDGNNFDVPFTPAFGNFKHADRSDFINGGWLSAADFPMPACTRRNAQGACIAWVSGGDLGRNTFRGPGLKLVDFSLGRSFGIPWFYGKEGARFQFRAEFYNLFNRVNMDPRSVVATINNGNFGRATGVFYPRTVQLAARIEF